VKAAPPPKPTPTPKPVEPVKAAPVVEKKVAVDAAGTVTIMLNFPSGRRVRQQFRTNQPGRVVYDFVAKDAELTEGSKRKKFYLSNGEERLGVQDTLQAQGVMRPTLMNVFLAWEEDGTAY
jgi:hypothetical protein